MLSLASVYPQQEERECAQSPTPAPSAEYTPYQAFRVAQRRRQLPFRRAKPVPVKFMQNDIFSGRDPRRFSKQNLIDSAREHFSFERSIRWQPEIHFKRGTIVNRIELERRTISRTYCVLINKKIISEGGYHFWHCARRQLNRKVEVMRA